MEWFEEALHPSLTQRLSMDRILFREKTDLQDLVIFDNRIFGRVLALDGIVQTTEGDEFIYHEMLSHVPILAHGAASRVLIIGGGDGGMAREVLKHPSVSAVTMVEIEPMIVGMSSSSIPPTRSDREKFCSASGSIGDANAASCRAAFWSPKMGCPLYRTSKSPIAIGA
jgi:spermidine synthase